LRKTRQAALREAARREGAPESGQPMVGRCLSAQVYPLRRRNERLELDNEKLHLALVTARDEVAAADAEHGRNAARLGREMADLRFVSSQQVRARALRASDGGHGGGGRICGGDSIWAIALR